MDLSQIMHSIGMSIISVVFSRFLPLYSLHSNQMHIKLFPLQCYSAATSVSCFPVFFKYIQYDPVKFVYLWLLAPRWPCRWSYRGLRWSQPRPRSGTAADGWGGWFCRREAPDWLRTHWASEGTRWRRYKVSSRVFNCSLWSIMERYWQWICNWFKALIDKKKHITV